MTFVKFKETYNIKTNLLSYQRVTSEIKSYLKLLNISSNDLKKKVNGFLLPNNMKIFYKSEKNSKDMYNVLNIKLK
jgi:hypothetical protein